MDPDGDFALGNNIEKLCAPLMELAANVSHQGTLAGADEPSLLCS
jgi:hypothetical protein